MHSAMISHQRWMLITTLLMTGALFLSAAATGAQQPAAIQKKQADLESLRGRIDAVESSLSKVREDQSSLAAAVRETEQAMSKLSTTIRELDEKSKAHEAEAVRLRANRDETGKKLHRQLELLGLQIRSSYISGRQQKVKMLLNQEDPARLGRMLAYYEYLTRARTERIDAIQTELLELIDLEAALEKELARIKILREQKAQQLAEMEKRRNERNEQINALEQDIRNSGKELSQLKQQESALESLIQALKENLKIPEEFRNAKPFGHSKGKLPWPMHGPILARYGEPKHGTSLKWNGIWIAGKPGKPIRAVSTGRVVYVGWLHRYGLIVVMEHPGGYYSLYGHNQEVMVSIGDSLKAGELLARAGDSGGHRQSGVYFEIRKGKSPVNPMSWLRR